MSFLTANGAPVQSGRVVFKAVGAWEAALDIDAQAPAIGDTVIIEAPGLQLTGTATLSGTDSGGQTALRVVAGAAKLTTVLPPRAQTITTVRDVLGSILKDAGEAASGLIDAALLTRPLSRWTRQKADAASALDALAKALGVTWRVLDDGKVWLGVDAGEPSSIEDVDQTAEKLDEGTVEIAPEVLSLRPGMTFRGGPVAMVTYTLAEGKVRATVNRTAGGSGAARAFAKAGEKAAAATKLHPPTTARVVGQNGDGSLELAVDSPEMPALSKVPLRHLLPGVTRCEMEPGATVSVFFEGGDAQKPYAALYAGGRTTKVTLDGDVFELGGTQPIVMEPALSAFLVGQMAFNTAVASVLNIPGPVIGALVPIPPVTPPVELASKKVFTE